MRFPTRLELLLATLIFVVANIPFAFLQGLWWNQVAFFFCIGSVLAQIALWRLWLYQKSKEETPSSPSQQPTSGISQNLNQSQSLFLSGNIIVKGLTVNPPHLHPSPNVSQFQPEARSMPVVGFRSWKAVSHHRLGIGPSWLLQSQNAQFGAWKPGRNNAVCFLCDYGGYYGPFSIGGRLSAPERPKPHKAPSAECACGFYVLTDFDKVPFETAESVATNTGVVQQPVTMIVGAVVGWGRVVQHGDEGWRAENVQLIALLDCKVSDEHLRITHEAAKSYGVPVVGRAALELLAKEYGEPFAKDATSIDGRLQTITELLDRRG